MLCLGTASAGFANRRAVQQPGGLFHKGEWMDSGFRPGLAPTVFLAEQPANHTLVPHFHRENQYQLFVEGEGVMGQHRLKSCVIHYASAFTGYGPIASGSEGLKYFTFRSRYDTGMTSLPQGVKPPKGSKAHMTARICGGRLESCAPLQLRHGMSSLAADDGATVSVFRLHPHAAIAISHASGCDGTFVFVLDGCVTSAAVSLGRWENLFGTPDEVLTFLAGAQGADIIALSMPPRHSDYVNCVTAPELIERGQLQTY